MDGSVRALAPDGSPRDWFNGFQWPIEGDRILLENKAGGAVVTKALLKDGTLQFESEGFGTGKRVPLPTRASP